MNVIASHQRSEAIQKLTRNWLATPPPGVRDDREGVVHLLMIVVLGRVNTNHVDDQGEMNEGGEHDVELFEA